MDARPIFIQTMWRSGGTYVWSKARWREGVAAFYEPLHESLSWATHDAFQRYYEGGMAPVLRHPPIGAHYFDEYPLRPDGGLAHFAPGLSYRRYRLLADESHSGLAAHIGALVEHARRAGRRPVMKFCRASMRAEWLCRTFSGYNITTVRDPASIHRSFLSRGGASNYFHAALLLILAENAHDPVFAEAVGFFKPPSPIDGPVADQLSHMMLVCAAEKQSQLWDLTLFFWALNLVSCVAAGGAVIDLNAVLSDIRYREKVEAQIEAEAGVRFDFSDISDTMRFPAQQSVSQEAAWLVTAALRHAGHQSVYESLLRGSELSPGNRQMLNALIAKG